jgi:DNA-binding response OmpR family regulator
VRVLVIEDEPKMATLIHRALQREGLAVDVAADGERAVLEATAVPYDVILLDRMLPGIDGAEVCRRLRSVEVRAPILMLTAMGEIPHRVEGLDAGADDYLTKPFVFEELLARIRALTRRSGQPAAAQIQTDDLRIDLLSRHAWRKDKRIDLSSREFALLEYFMRHNGQVLSRQQILSAIWDYDFEPASNVVDVYVRHLRNKVDPPDGPSSIQTVRGAGYRFDPATNS